MSTVLLLHFDGVNGSTTFTDSSGHGHVATAVSTATITTNHSQFGNASLALDGSGYVDLDGGPELSLGTGDYTVDLRFRPDPLNTNNAVLISNMVSGLSGGPGDWMIGTFNDNLTFRADGGSFGIKIFAPVLAVGGWYHIALTRASGITRLFCNGVQVGGTYTTVDDFQSPAGWPKVGGGPVYVPNTGNIDEVRIIKGYAAWTSDFTPPTGPYSPDQVYDRDTFYSNARGPEYHVQLRSWISNVSLALTTVTPPNPFAKYDWPLTSGPQQPDRAFVAFYNRNLIGQDKLPFNQEYWPLTPAAIREANLSTWIDQVKLLLAVPFKQTDWPVPRPPLPEGKTWLWSYNLNLIGQDQLPTGDTVTDIPPQPPLTAIQLRTWINSISLALTAVTRAPFSQLDWPLTPAAVRPNNLSSWLDQTRLLLAVPFTQSDWPVPRPQAPAARTWLWSYNLNLIGQDKLPVGDIVTDLPPRAPQQPIPIFTATYLKTLIGQDQLPVGDDIWEIPPRDYERSIQLRTWIQTVNLALTTQAATLPFNQYDWPNPTLSVRQARSWTSFYNLDLIGQDKLPFRQQDWPNPTQPFRPLSLVTWIDRAKAYLQRPLRQTDWPVPRAPLQPAFSWTASYNLNLIGKDRLPNRQQDWPLPRDPRQPDVHGVREFVSILNLPLKFPPFTGLLPRNQYTWPLPQQPAELRSRYSLVFNGFPFYPPTPPEPPPPTPPEDVRLVYNAGNEWQMLDRIREPGPVGWR